MIVTSRDNHLIKQVKRLITDPGARREQRLFVAEGARLCADAAISGIRLRTVLHTESAAASYKEQFKHLLKSGAQTICISDDIAARLGDTVSTQGMFCVGEWRDHDTLKCKIEKTILSERSVIALECVRDPSNMGAIIRTAEAFGISALFISDGCCDIYAPKVLRASMGGVFRLPVIHAGKMADAVRGWQSQGICCWACVADQDVMTLPKADIKRGCICLIGNEGAGLTVETVSECNERLTIPMRGRAESLNAGVAAAVVMWTISASG